MAIALAALSKIDAPDLPLDELALQIQATLGKAGVTTGAMLLSAKHVQLDANEPSRTRPAVQIVVPDHSLPAAIQEQVLRTLVRPPSHEVDVVVAPYRFRLLPLGSGVSGAAFLLLFRPGPLFRKAQGPIMHLAVSLLRMKVASLGATITEQDADCLRIGRLYRVLRAVEWSQEPSELSQAVLSQLRELIPFDVAALLVDDQERAVLTILPGRPLTSATAAGISHEIRTEHLNQDPRPTTRLIEDRLLPAAGSADAPASESFESRVSLPLMSPHGRLVGRLTVAAVDAGRYGKNELLTLLTLADQLSALLENRGTVLELERQAKIDEMTELYNYRTFRTLLSSEFARSTRYGKPLSLMMLDLDHFKKINDTYGHPRGDHVLKAVARVLLRTKRAEDIVARYGGEEFAMILPETSAEGAILVAERIRKQIERARIMRDFKVTVSIGVATGSGDRGRTEKRLVADADAALYRAKRNGRNRVEN